MIHSKLQLWWLSSLARYAAAFLSVAIAIIAAEVVTRLLNAEAIASAMLCAVIFAAWGGGIGPALLASALALLAFHYYLVPPGNSFVWKDELFTVSMSEIPRLVLFSFTSLIVGSVISAQRKATQELRRAGEALRVSMEDQKKIQSVLRRSEMYLTAAQTLSGTGSFGWNVAGEQMIWSDQTFQIFGCNQGTKPTVELVVQRTHPEDRAAVQEIIDRASRGGENFDFEHRLLMPDGSVKYVRAAARAERNTSGGVEFVGVVTDVTSVRETERKLRRSEAYLSEAQRLSQTSSWAWDVRLGEFVYRSPEVYNLFGLDPKNDTTSQQSFYDRILPEDRERVIDMAQRAVREKAELEVDFRIARPDGSIRYVHSVWHPLIGEDGEVVELVGTHIDVTEQRLANLKLQNAFDEIKRSEDRFRLVVDTIPALVWRATPDGIPDFLNQQALDYTGLTPDQAETGWPRAFHPEDKKSMLLKWSAIRASRMPGELEARLRRYDGEYRWFLFRAEPLRDDLGNIVKWYGSSTDIDDRKRTEEELRRSEAQLAKAQRVSQTGSFVWNLATGERRGSKEFFRILGYDDPHSVTFEMVLQRAHPGDRAQVERAIQRASRAGEDLDYEHRLLMPDGSVKYVHVVAHAGRNQANQLEYIGAVVDITATKQAQEKFDKAQTELARVTRVTTLGELTASIAHEVKQPIGAIVTNAQAALRFLDAEVSDRNEVREVLRDIVKDGNRAGEVISRIRDLTKKTPPRRNKFEINETIREVVELIRGEATKNRMSIHVELANDLPFVWGDRIELQQVILNLMMNGIEAMQWIEDRPRELVIRSVQDETQQVRVSVMDRGIGFSVENVDRLFSAFFTTKPDGMGMGLSICRSIIEGHNGRLWATANAPYGATFQFTLPVGDVSTCLKLSAGDYS
jgi:PAS domain S-box-containing protein